MPQKRSDLKLGN